MKKIFKQDKGVAGLSILLSVVVMLFVIGLLVMIFSIMGNKLQVATYDYTSATSTNESLAKPTTAGITLTTGDSAVEGVCGNVTAIWNGTVSLGNVLIGLGNITQSGCTVHNATLWASYTANVRYTYPYTYGANNTATDVMKGTITGISGTTAWFSIFVVISAMVVLILLTVIIISAIKGSGMVEGMASTNGAKNVGTA